MNRGKGGLTLQQRVDRMTDKSAGPEGCWIWQGSTAHGFGYGCIRIDGKTCMAHRVALHLSTGVSLDTKQQALHSCDNPPCVNPAHLRWGSQKENIADAMGRGRFVPPPVSRAGRSMPGVRGESNPRASTTEPAVRAFRRDVADGMPVAAAGRKHGMSKGQAHAIATGRTWKHVA